MAHCAKEPPLENTIRVSWQVLGDNTAHTVMTRAIGFMPNIPALAHRRNTTMNYANPLGKFQYGVKIPNRIGPQLA
ncbi:hypothetical protein [Bradyrhizobium sp. ARR65]|uniref:hypothetical protein n=1 Tax=Bradyrhizobium sp. ARR65 TaxID=1040989 RepID=UPI0018DBC564|nr:hypothetical protein [Bradyrhizobium sp. ARR65]